MPIAEDIALMAKQRRTENTSTSSNPSTLLIGVQGCQGSGKSTLSEFLKSILTTRFKLRTAVLSIDDFYLTKQERKDLAKTIHPLLETRGVPGTHDVPLAQNTIEQLIALQEEQKFHIPRFNKAIDDRADTNEWDSIEGPVDIIIFEGWCVGLQSQPQEMLSQATNQLEKDEDTQAIWRSYVNKQLAEQYQPLFDTLDYLVVLKAPSFDCVYQWRLLQEEKLIAKIAAENSSLTGQNNTMSPEQILRFISHYERLTTHALASLPAQADCLLTLQEDHSISQLLIHGKAVNSKDTHYTEQSTTEI